jgi:hypothetical protein
MTTGFIGQGSARHAIADDGRATCGKNGEIRPSEGPHHLPPLPEAHGRGPAMTTTAYALHVAATIGRAWRDRRGVHHIPARLARPGDAWRDRKGTPWRITAIFPDPELGYIHCEVRQIAGPGAMNIVFAAANPITIVRGLTAR